jgi:CDP-diacylglycerol--glycerol-3-phosphate 3-phosphatidyltransferase
MVDATKSRRPLQSRNRAWAIGAAAFLARSGAGPNAISLASILFAGAAAAALVAGGRSDDALHAVLMLAAAAGIQLRLLCNLLDGMVAVEGGRGSKSGEVFNDAPDRAADAILFVAAGYALPWPAWGCALGWAAALLAVLTAYVRVLGGALGRPQDFAGPMAKQHRMAVLTIACLGSIFESLLFDSRGWVLGVGLAAIVLGSAMTIARRLVRLVRALEAA